MTTKKMKLFLRSMVVIAAIIVTGFLALYSWSNSLVDLRNDSLNRNGIGQEQATKGRQLLLLTANRHGLQNWEKYSTCELTCVDEWDGIMGKSGRHWPEVKQTFRFQTLLGTFTSRVELLDGPQKGEIWGIQSWACYKKKNESAEPVFQHDESIHFYLPAIQYFSGLPFRLQSAEVFAYMGERTLNGQNYDLVFVSWGHNQPNEVHDQYILWINKETFLIDIVHYTVREAFNAAQGTIYFSDYREVQGVWLPFVQTVKAESPKEGETAFPLSLFIGKRFFHEIRILDAGFDVFRKEILIPDPSKAAPGDIKVPVKSYLLEVK